MNEPVLTAIGSPSSVLNSTLAMKIDRPVLSVLPTHRTLPAPGAGEKRCTSSPRVTGTWGATTVTARRPER